MNNNIHIGIIDDGISYKKFNIGELYCDVEITDNLQVRNRANYVQNINHGTICAGVIKKYLPEAKLSSIKVLNENRKCTFEQLVLAIRWCVEKKIKIINMSLGSIWFKDCEPIRDAVDYAYRNGVIMIAASNNGGFVTYPSAFYNVIGVKADRAGLLKEGEYFYNSMSIDRVEITSYGRFKYKDKDSEFTVDKVNSYAAPYITVLVHNIIKSNINISFEDLRRELFKGCKNYRKNYSMNNFCYNFHNNIDWAKRVFFIEISEGDNKQTKFSDMKRYYPFEVVKEVHIVFERDSFKKPSEYFSGIDITKLRFDSVVIHNSLINESQKVMEELLNYFIEIDKNIIYLNDQSNRNSFKIPDVDYKGKMFYSPMFSRMKGLVTSEENIETQAPRIGILDFTDNNYSVRETYELSKLFRDKDYYSVGIVDSSLGVLAGLEYGIEPSMINGISQKYLADILIIGKKIFSHTKEAIELLIDQLELDIVMLVVNDNNKWIMELLVSNSNILFVILDTNCKFANLNCKNAEVFNLNIESCSYEIFKYLLKLFE